MVKSMGIHPQLLLVKPDESNPMFQQLPGNRALLLSKDIPDQDRAFFIRYWTQKLKIH